MLDWITCIETFNKVVEVNSFADVSRKLYTTPSAISKRIAWLEEALGVLLFNRTTRKLNLTEAGSALYARSKPLVNEWQDVKSEITSINDEPHGLLRLGMPIAFGNQHVVNILPDFLAQYPKIQVDLRLTNCLSGLLNEQIDIFVSYGDDVQNPDALNTVPVTKTCRQVFAAPSYLEKHGHPNTIDELSQHNCLMSNCVRVDTPWKFADKAIPVSGNFYSNNKAALVSSAVNGVGIINIWPFIIKDEIASGQLVSLFPELYSEERMLYAYYPKLKFTPKKTQVFLDYMQAHLEGI